MQTETDQTESIDAQAHDVALAMLNGRRNDARQFIAAHPQPATLALKVVRNLWNLSTLPGSPESILCDALLDVQALLDAQDQV